MSEIIRDAGKNRLYIQLDISTPGTGAGMDFREKMLVNNRIPGILDLKVNVTDNRKTFEYDTAGLITLESLCLQQNIDTVTLKKIFSGLAKIVSDGEKYLLEQNDFLIGPEYIFLDKEQNPYAGYCPGYGKPMSEQIGNVAEYLMNRIDYHNKESVLMTYTIYKKSREEGFYIGEITDYLNVAKEDPGERPKEQRSEPPDRSFHDAPVLTIERKPLINEEDFTVFESEKKRGTDRSLHIKPGQSNIILFVVAVLIPVLLVGISVKAGLVLDKNGKTDIVKLAAVAVLGIGVAVYVIKKTKKSAKEVPKDIVPEEDEATELLFSGGVPSMGNTCILESGEFPVIRVNELPFSIGKDREHMDFCLDYQGVSRCHARLERMGTGIGIVDCGSTNGTYLNGTKLDSNRPYLLNDGDKLNLGICTYRFKEGEGGIHG